MTASHVELYDCSFQANRCTYTGAGVRAGLSLVAQGCEFMSNTGGVGTSAGAARSLGPCEITDCVFFENEAQNGSALFLDDEATVSRCLFVRNRAGAGDFSWNGCAAVYFKGDTGLRLVDQCTFAFNVGVFASSVGNEQGAPAIVRNSIMAFGTGTPAGPNLQGACPTLECCDLFGNTTPIPTRPCMAAQFPINGNFLVDPLFCDVENDDFTLRSDSPCAPPGPTDCGLVGASPPGCGAVAVGTTFESMTWGKVKGAYR